MDEAVQELIRKAEASGDSSDWLRAARALVRAGRLDEAGRAAIRATDLVARTEVLDLVTPTRFELSRFELPCAGVPAWFPDEERLAVATEDAVLVVSLDGEIVDVFERSSPAREPPRVSVAVDPSGKKIAVSTPLSLIDVQTRKTEVLGPRKRRVAFTPEGELVDFSHESSIVRGDEELDGVVVSLDAATGSFVRLARGELTLHAGARRTTIAPPLSKRKRLPPHLRVYTLCFAAGPRVVWNVEPDLTLVDEGNVLSRVSGEARVKELVPSPTGRAVAFDLWSIPFGSGTAFAVRVLGGERQSLVTTREVVLGIAWSPTGRRFVAATAGEVFVALAT